LLLYTEAKNAGTKHKGAPRGSRCEKARADIKSLTIRSSEKITPRQFLSMVGAAGLLRVSLVLLLLLSSAQAFVGGKIFLMARQQRTVTIHACTLDGLRNLDVPVHHSIPSILLDDMMMSIVCW